MRRTSLSIFTNIAFLHNAIAMKAIANILTHVISIHTSIHIANTWRCTKLRFTSCNRTSPCNLAARLMAPSLCPVGSQCGWTAKPMSAAQITKMRTITSLHHILKNSLDRLYIMVTICHMICKIYHDRPTKTQIQSAERS